MNGPLDSVDTVWDPAGVRFDSQPSQCSEWRAVFCQSVCLDGLPWQRGLVQVHGCCRASSLHHMNTNGLQGVLPLLFALSRALPSRRMLFHYGSVCNLQQFNQKIGRPAAALRWGGRLQIICLNTGGEEFGMPRDGRGLLGRLGSALFAFWFAYTAPQDAVHIGGEPGAQITPQINDKQGRWIRRPSMRCSLSLGQRKCKTCRCLHC